MMRAHKALIKIIMWLTACRPVLASLIAGLMLSIQWLRKHRSASLPFGWAGESNDGGVLA